MEQETEKLAVSLREAAVMTGVSPRTLQNYIRTKQLPVRKLGRRTLIQMRHLRAFLEADRASAGAPTSKDRVHLVL